MEVTIIIMSKTVKNGGRTGIYKRQHRTSVSVPEDSGDTNINPLRSPETWWSFI